MSSFILFVSEIPRDTLTLSLLTPGLRFGRKTVFSVGIVSYLVLSIASCWLPSFTAILASRFFLGFLHPAGLQVAYVLGERKGDFSALIFAQGGHFQYALRSDDRDVSAGLLPPFTHPHRRPSAKH